jgi:hypothetical protein
MTRLSLTLLGLCIISSQTAVSAYVDIRLDNKGVLELDGAQSHQLLELLGGHEKGHGYINATFGLGAQMSVFEVTHISLKENGECAPADTALAVQQALASPVKIHVKLNALSDQMVITIPSGPGHTTLYCRLIDQTV